MLLHSTFLEQQPLCHPINWRVNTFFDPSICSITKSKRHKYIVQRYAIGYTYRGEFVRSSIRPKMYKRLLWSVNMERDMVRIAHHPFVQIFSLCRRSPFCTTTSSLRLQRTACLEILATPVFAHLPSSPYMFRCIVTISAKHFLDVSQTLQQYASVSGVPACCRFWAVLWSSEGCFICFVRRRFKKRYSFQHTILSFYSGSCHPFKRVDSWLCCLPETWYGCRH